MDGFQAGRAQRRPHVALMAVTLLVVAACGTGGATSSPGASAPASAAETSSPAASAAGGFIVVASGAGQFGDCLRSAYHEPFQEETGIEVIGAPDLGTDGAAIRTQVETGVHKVDVFYASPEVVVRQGDALLEPLDYTKINRDDFIQGLALDRGIGAYTFTIILGYNRDVTGGKAPTKLEDFFDLQNFPGKRGFRTGRPVQLLAYGLMADGVAPEDLFPIDWDRAFAKLDTIKDELVSWESGANAKDLLESGETPLIMVSSNNVKTSLDAGKPVGGIWDGALVQTDLWVIPKGAPKKDVGLQFIEFITRPEQNAAMSACMPIAPANKLTPVDEGSEWWPTSHLDERQIVLSDPEIVSWIAENQDEIDERFQNWLAE